MKIENSENPTSNSTDTRRFLSARPVCSISIIEPHSSLTFSVSSRVWAHPRMGFGRGHPHPKVPRAERTPTRMVLRWDTQSHTRIRRTRRPGASRTKSRW